MATEIKSWEIIDGKLQEINTNLIEQGRLEKEDLENWIASEPQILGEDIAIIGRQVSTKSGPLDILGIDKSGNIVIIELKRDKLPREALAQAIDYASDISQWSLDKLSEVVMKYTENSLEDFITEAFEDINIENITINQAQRILLIGFAIEDSLERMVSWLSDNYGVNVNALVFHYSKTQKGGEIITRTFLIPEEVEKERGKRKKITFKMSDKPGTYDNSELKELLTIYFNQDLKSAHRIKNVLLPECLKKEIVTREELKKAFIKYKEPNAEKNAGYFMSLISLQIGMEKNDFLRQIIEYEYPNNPWEKDNYRIREGYKELVKELILIPQEI
jgi:hypothetical protein